MQVINIVKNCRQKKWHACMQVINIVTLGSPVGKGVFFPEGLLGAIVTPFSFNESRPALDSFPPTSSNKVASQVGSAHATTPACMKMLVEES